MVAGGAFTLPVSTMNSTNNPRGLTRIYTRKMRKSKNHTLLLSFPVNRSEDPTVGYLNGLKKI